MKVLILFTLTIQELNYSFNSTKRVGVLEQILTSKEKAEQMSPQIESKFENKIAGATHA